MSNKDVEKGEKRALLGDTKLIDALGSGRALDKRGGLSGFPEVPVGGHPGNEKFYTVVQMAVRLTIMCLLIGCMVWMPEKTKAAGMDRFSKHAGLAACLMIFFTNFTVGGVLNTASAGVSGCFAACLNIWLLRGFFPDGVTPGMSSTSPASLVGWIDLCIYNLMVLGFNCRMGFRMTAMALNVGFMMCFLNPADQTVFSKNFQINPNGAAVSAFVGVCFGSLCAVLAVLLPYPLGWAAKNMKSAGMTATEDTCKMFIAAVKYFKGSSANVLIERQLAESEILKAEIDGLGANISDAYVESFDIATQGTIRVLYEKHSAMMGELYDVLNALQFALATEDFGPSHVTCMETIGDAAHDVVDATSCLLIAATAASADGLIDNSEKSELEGKEKIVKETIHELSKAFQVARKAVGKPVCKELMNESFFVYCISQFGRKAVDYSTLLRTNPPSGKSFFSEVSESIKGLVEVPMWYHYRVVSRYWLSLMGCFLFSVHMDNFVPSCAITGVFLINTRVGPDVLAMIQGLLAVVVGIVTNALMYSYSCKFGNTHALMVVAVFYWLATITVGKGSSSLAGIGLLMSALSPFALYKFCIPNTAAAAEASAIGLWTGIRALLIAVVITVLMEFLHVPGLFTTLCRNKLDEAFVCLQKASKNIWPEGSVKDAKTNVDDALGAMGGLLGSCKDFNTAAKMEPRLWKCPWKMQFVNETCFSMNQIRLDILLMKQAMCGVEGNMEEIIEIMNKVKAVGDMRKDLIGTLDDGRELCIALLDLEFGPFKGLTNLDTVEGLDELDGYDEAIASQSEQLTFPEEAPETMEDDKLVRISIVFVMLDYLIKHTSSMVKAAVKLS